MIDTQKKRMWIRIDKIPCSAYIPPIIDYTEENRYMSEATTPLPGAFTRKVAPHMVEITERLHPDDPCTHVALMKSVQSTATTHAEFFIMHGVRFRLGNFGFYTASRELAEIRSKANIDVAIDDTAGLKGMVKPLSERNVRKKGDSTFLKEFGAVKLTINSFNSISAMKSMTMGNIIVDEADEMLEELKGQGNTMSIIEGRTLAVRNPKMFVLSTPTDMATSLIYKLFMAGDQRYYFINCPLCGEPEVMVFMEATKDHGFTFQVEGKKNRVIPETIGYVCKHCKKKWHENKKEFAMENGVWRPTATSQDPKKHSYHVSGLMSPSDMLSWGRIATKSAEHNKGTDVLKYKDFTINIKGWPWRAIRSQSKKADFIENNMADYVMGDVPSDVLILFGGVDVQKDRVEYCVLGFGRGRCNYLIDHKVFYGKTFDPDDPVWQNLSNYAYSTTYKIKGLDIRVSKVGIDCGWNPTKEYGAREKDFASKSVLIYDFIATRTDLFVPIKGSGTLKGGSIIKPGTTNHQFVTKVYVLNSSLFKEVLYTEIAACGASSIRLPQNMMVEGVKTPFPSELVEQLLSERQEEVKPGVVLWKKRRKRNELLDIVIYARAMAIMQNVNTWDEDWWDIYEKELTGL